MIQYPVKPQPSRAKIVQQELGLPSPNKRSSSLHRQIYRLGELFAGAGGMSLGAHIAKHQDYGYCHAWANDKDKDACRTLAANLSIDSTDVHCCDVRDLDFDRLPAIDGLVFGFPCNDFSMIGDRKGISGEYGGLYKWGVRGLESKNPLFFVAENVDGLASSGNDLQIILEAIRKTGYIVFPHTYQFAHYGVAQSRQRIVIVGFRSDLGITEFDPPAPTTRDKPISCGEALRGIREDAHNNERTKQAPRVVERLKHIKPGENAFTADLPDRLKLSLKSKATLSLIYKRLKRDEPSYTVTGSGGGGTHVYHWEEDRALTNRERARLQSFPDDFVFYGGKESVRRQIGMAVPPEGVRHIFLSVLRVLAKREILSQC